MTTEAEPMQTDANRRFATVPRFLIGEPWDCGTDAWPNKNYGAVAPMRAAP